MWNVFDNLNGDNGWTWAFVYDDHIPGYTESELKNLTARIIACETESGFGCGISHQDLRAAVYYVNLYWRSMEVLCTTYLKTNLIYDLETNNASLTHFTDIFYYDYRSSLFVNFTNDLFEAGVFFDFPTCLKSLSKFD